MATLKIRGENNEILEIPVFQGEPGKNGDDGFSPIISVSKEGSITTISFVDKTGIKTATINDGEKGTPGTAGKSAYTYAKEGGFIGTEEKFSEKLAYLMGHTVLGYVDEENDITISGNLPSGTYTIKYEMTDGETIEVGTVDIVNNAYTEVELSGPNLLDVYEVHMNQRFSADAGTQADTPGVITLSIPFADIVGKVIRLVGFKMTDKYGSARGNTAKWYHFTAAGERTTDFGANTIYGFWTHFESDFGVTEQPDGSFYCKFTDPASYGDGILHINLVVLPGGATMTEDDLVDKGIEFIDIT